MFTIIESGQRLSTEMNERLINLFYKIYSQFLYTYSKSVVLSKHSSHTLTLNSNPNLGNRVRFVEHELQMAFPVFLK